MSSPRRKQEPTDATVRAALASIPASIDRETWVRVGMALESFYGAEGFEVFRAWSEQAEIYKAKETEAVWKSFGRGDGVAIGTLFRVARRYGFDLAAQYAREEEQGSAATVAKPSAEERERAESERRERDARTRAQREREQQEGAAGARQRWERAAPIGRAPYLVRKGISAPGCRFEPGGVLLVPMRDAEGVVCNVQAIDVDGSKRFAKGAPVKGLHCWIGDPAGASVLLLCEGFATGATLHAAGGAPVAVAFNAGNLAEVAGSLAGRYPAARWVVAADDDRDTEARSGRNPGQDAARRAAQRLGGVVVVPQSLPEGGTDFNDLESARGREVVAEQLRRAIAAPEDGGAAPGESASVGALSSTENGDIAGAEGAPAAGQGAALLRLESSAGAEGEDGEPHAPGDALQGRENSAQGARSPRTGKARGKGGGRRGGPPGGSGGGGDEGGGDGERGDPFLLTDEGVFYIAGRDGDYTPRKVCDPIEVMGCTRSAEGWGWGKLVRFTNRDGERREWILPDELLAGDGVELRKTLAWLGLWITPINGLRARLVEYFETRKTAARVRTVGVTGWAGQVFVLPGESIGADSEPVIYHAPGDPGLRLEQRGTLQGWQQAIGRLAVGNTRLLFAVSMAFAAPLLALSGERNGGFHLRGTSQDGKTTALSMAASVFSGPGYVRKWRATDNAIEGVAALHSDLPLLLDELHQCAPRLVGDVAYLLAEGQGKARGERAGGLRQVLRWRSLFLSTGETGLAEYMATAGVKSTAGQEMRFAEIPASPEAGHGVFENLHGEPDGASFALRLRDVMTSQYGTAGRAWLQWLVAHYAEAAAEVQRRIRELVADWVPAGASGQAESVARRFALVAVAGEMATRAGITGWRLGEAVAAVRLCLEAWLDVRGGAGRSEERELLRRLRTFLQTDEHRFEWWERAHDDHAGKTLKRAGFRKRYFNGEPVEKDEDVHRLTGRDSPNIVDAQNMTVDFYVFPDVFRAEVVAEVDLRFAHRVLVERGILKTEKNGGYAKPTRRERLPGGANSRVYVIEAAGRQALEDALYSMGG